MRGARAACGRRAGASAAASLSLHFLVVVGTTSMFLGVTSHALWSDADPTVEIVTLEERARPHVRPPSGVAGRGVPRTLAFARVSAPPPAEPIAKAVPETAVPPSAAGPGTASPEGEPSARDPAAPIASTVDENPHEGTPLSPGEGLPDDGIRTTDLRPANPVSETGLPRLQFSQDRLDEVTRQPSLSAQAESEVMVGRREVFEFLLDHPDFATHITRALRLARYRIWRTDEGMFIDDGWGATGQITVVYAADGTRMLYAKGEFHHKLLPAIPGEAVVTIDYEAWPTEDGRQLLQARLSGQLKIDSAFATLMLKIASSVAREKAAKESRRLLRTFANVLRAIDETPAAVYASVSARPDVPRHELERFRALLGLP